MTLRTPTRVYGFALAALAALVALRWLLEPWLQGQLPFATVFAAVALAAWLGGWIPAMLTSFAALIACEWLFVLPHRADGFGTPGDFVGVAAYLVSCATIAVLGEAARIARLRANASRTQLEREADQHRRTGEALRTSQTWLRVATEGAEMFAWDCDVAARTIRWSDSAAAVLGRPAEQLPQDLDGAHFFIAPDELARVLQEWQDTFTSGRDTFVAEFRGAGRSGGTHHYLAQARVTYDAGGHPVRLIGVTQDITDRSLAEAAVRSSEARQAFLVRLGDVLRPLGDPIEVQRTAARLLGVHLGVSRVSFADIEGDEGLFHPGFVDGVAPLEGRLPLSGFGAVVIERCRRGETLAAPDVDTEPGLTGSEREGLHAAGIAAFVAVMLVRSRTWVAAFCVHSATPRAWTSTEVELVRDVAERTWSAVERARAEQALRESDAVLRRQAAIFEHQTDAIVVTDPAGRILDWNPACERMLGYTRDEVLGRTPAMFSRPEDATRLTPEVTAAMARGGIWQGEVTFVRKDGSLGECETVVKPLTDPAGRVVGAVGVNRDVTERRQAERTLRESEERFRMLADHMSQLAWTCDELGVATWYNRRWLEYTGLTFEEMREWGWRKVHHPKHLDRVLAGIEHSRLAGEVWEDTFPLLGRDGRYRWFLSRAVPIKDETGRVVRWFGTNTDVTELRQVQQELRDADRRKDEFLATLAHELRNPLAPIRNAIEMLRSKDSADPEERWGREVIERQVSQMTRLLDDLLDVNRISRGKIDLRRARVTLSSVVQSALETSRPLIDRHRHELGVTLPDRPVMLDADPVRLAQVFANLLNNAAKYTPEGGRIALVATCDGGGVTVSVRDNGIGIPADVLPHVFRMFSQATPARERSPGGLGIGLSLVRGLVELHGGHVEARSEGPGRGSEFIVHLPVAAEPAEPPAAADGNGSAHVAPGRRVLVADDLADSADSLAMLLQLGGHTVQVAYDGEQAIRMAAEFRPELVLLDIGMPKVNGYDACRRMRAEPWAAGAMFVALTGWGQEADRRRSQDAGFHEHVVKPVDRERLGRLLASLPRAGELAR